MAFDDDAEEDHSGFIPPPHPDDRIWRHPSEVRSHPIVPIRVGGGTAPGARSDQRSAARRHRGWPAVLSAAAAGAVLAGAASLGIARLTGGDPEPEVAGDETSTTVGWLFDNLRGAPPPSTVGVAPGDPASPGADGTDPAVGPGAPAAGDGGPAGAGVVLTADGVVVTSAALVGDDDPTVVLADGSRSGATVVGTDALTGLAVVELPGDDHRPSVTVTEPSLAPGQVARVDGGAATGDPALLVEGTVVGTGTFPLAGGGDVDAIEMTGDATGIALGSPVLDEAGAVAGIVVGIAEDGDTGADAGAGADSWYVIPAGVAARVAHDLVTDGVAHDVRLGIEGLDITVGDAPGATVTEVIAVTPDGPADRAGIRVGDRVLAVDGHEVADMTDLVLTLRARSPGDEVDVEVLRDGTPEVLTATLADAPRNDA